MLIAAGRHTVVYGTRGGGGENKTKNRIFIIQAKKLSFGNLYSNVDFLIITKHSGGLAAMHLSVCNYMHWYDTLGMFQIVKRRWKGEEASTHKHTKNETGEETETDRHLDAQTTHSSRRHTHTDLHSPDTEASAGLQHGAIQTMDLFIYIFIYWRLSYSPVNRTGSPQGFSLDEILHTLDTIGFLTLNLFSEQVCVKSMTSSKGLW